MSVQRLSTMCFQVRLGLGASFSRTRDAAFSALSLLDAAAAALARLPGRRLLGHEPLN